MTSATQVHTTQIRVTILRQHPGLELRNPRNPTLTKRIEGPLSLWGSMEYIRGIQWFIPDGWNGYGILYNFHKRSLLAAWDDQVIDAYEIVDGNMRELFHVD